MKKSLILILVLFCLVQSSRSQGYIIDYVYKPFDERSQYLSEVIFRDTLKNEVVKKIDVGTLNPFGNLPYPISDKFSREIGGKVYDLTGKSLKNIVPENVIRRYKIPYPESVFPSIGQVYIQNRTRIDVAVLKFSLMVGNDNRPILSYSDLYAFTADGNELFKLTNNDVNILDVDVAPGNNYIYYTYGFSIPDTMFLKGGIHIIDLVENKYIEFPGEELTVRYFGPGLLYLFYNGEITDGRPDRWMKIYDLEKDKVYTKQYTYTEMLKIKVIKQEGILYKDGSMEDWRDLSREELSWENWKKSGK